jgi:hypothetical protein
MFASHIVHPGQMHICERLVKVDMGFIDGRWDDPVSAQFTGYSEKHYAFWRWKKESSRIFVLLRSQL